MINAVKNGYLGGQIKSGGLNWKRPVFAVQIWDVYVRVTER